MNLQGHKHIVNLLNIRPFPSNSALERVLILSELESPDIGCRYPDPTEFIAFASNSYGKSHALACESTLVASGLCDITRSVNARLREVYEREITLVAD